jgi:hypothetical protein
MAVQTQRQSVTKQDERMLKVPRSCGSDLQDLTKWSLEFPYGANMSSSSRALRGKKRMDERRTSIGELSCLSGEISMVMGWASPTLMVACRGLSKWDALEHCRMRRKGAEGQTKYRSDGSVNTAKVTHTRPKQYGWLLRCRCCDAQG